MQKPCSSAPPAPAAGSKGNVPATVGGSGPATVTPQGAAQPGRSVRKGGQK